MKEKKGTENTENINPPEGKSDDYWDYIKMNLLEVNFQELLAKNSDTVGWIQVNGANVTIEGTLDVSRNAFGGIELSKGTNVETTPVINFDNATVKKLLKVVTNQYCGQMD